MFGRTKSKLDLRSRTLNPQDRPAPRRILDDADILELQEIHRGLQWEKFKLTHMRGDTYIIPDGQKLVKQQEAVITLLERVQKYLIGQKLLALGFPPKTKVSIDIRTGVVSDAV